MSIRASLSAKRKGKAVEVGEAVSWIPLLWVSLLSSDDVDKLLDDHAGAVVDATRAVQRCSTASPFLASLFPEFMTIHDVANDFLGILQRSKAETFEIWLGDHIAMNPDTFLPTLKVAVASLESKKATTSLRLPARTALNPFTNKVAKFPAVKLSETRDILCLASSMNPLQEDEEAQRDQLVGYLFLENYSQKKIDARSKRGRAKRRT